MQFVLSRSCCGRAVFIIQIVATWMLCTWSTSYRMQEDIGFQPRRPIFSTFGRAIAHKALEYAFRATFSHFRALPLNFFASFASSNLLTVAFRDTPPQPLGIGMVYPFCLSMAVSFDVLDWGCWYLAHIGCRGILFVHFGGDISAVRD